MPRSRKTQDPLMGWVEAGSDMVSEQVEEVTSRMNRTIEDRRQALESTLDELQSRGEVIDSKLRQALSPSAFFAGVEELVKSSPLWTLVPTLKPSPNRREQQLALLSAKVDLLVEQVALLAAKQAKQNAEEKPQAEEQDTPAANPPTSSLKTDSSSNKQATKSTPRQSARKKAPASSAAKKSDK